MGYLEMDIQEQLIGFMNQFGKEVLVGGTNWRYYRLGSGSPVFWLTGGLRRATLGFAFMEKLAAHHTIIAPDYPPVQTIGEIMTAFDTILQTEGIGNIALGGQSYGGMLAQAYLAYNPQRVERLILSSTGPADYGKAWLPVEFAFITLATLLPEKTIKRMFFGGLLKVVTLPEADRTRWREAIGAVMQRELSRADVVSHFAVAASLIRESIITPAAYQNWQGRTIILSAKNDLTQSKKDIPRYERLFGSVEVINLGNLGHTAAFTDPERYVELLEQALV